MLYSHAHSGHIFVIRVGSFGTTSIRTWSLRPKRNLYSVHLMKYILTLMKHCVFLNLPSGVLISIRDPGFLNNTRIQLLKNLIKKFQQIIYQVEQQSII